MECVQDVVAKSAEDSTEKGEATTEPRRTSEVKWAFTACAEPQAPLEQGTLSQAVLWSPPLVSLPLPVPAMGPAFCLFSLLWQPMAFTKAPSLRCLPPWPRVPRHTLASLAQPPVRAFGPQCCLVQIRVSEQRSPCPECPEVLLLHVC